jgi:hypothetical protein
LISRATHRERLPSPSTAPAEDEHLEQEALEGGYANSVVRVGATTRRLAGPWTPTIQRLLSHVRARGVLWVPEPLGFDETGREVLSYIPGEVPHDSPTWTWSESVLTDAARALRQWHDATVDFDLTGAVWNMDPCVGNDVICHNDFAPYNCVFRDEQLVGAIDFDMCTPGTRTWDLAFSAYNFVPLMPPATAAVPDDRLQRSPYSVPEMWARLDAFLDAYAAGDANLRYDVGPFAKRAVGRISSMSAFAKYLNNQLDDARFVDRIDRYRVHAQWLDAQT